MRRLAGDKRVSPCGNGSRLRLRALVRPHTIAVWWGRICCTAVNWARASPECSSSDQSTAGEPDQFGSGIGFEFAGDGGCILGQCRIRVGTRTRIRTHSPISHPTNRFVVKTLKATELTKFEFCVRIFFSLSFSHHRHLVQVLQNGGRLPQTPHTCSRQR